MIVVIHVCVAIMWWACVLGALMAYDRAVVDGPQRVPWTMVLVVMAWALTLTEMWL